MRLFILTFLFYLSATHLFAQTKAFIDGYVKDQSGQSIVGVNVFTEAIRKGAVTNAHGYFNIPDLSPGHYDLKISSVGYETIIQAVDATNQGSLNIEIRLKESLYQLSELVVQRETLTGGSQLIHDIPGSAHYIGARELAKFNYSDVNRILRNIPGVNIQEEEGFGLRPNIGLRGTGVERSSKITLMEDGILMAPAPYAASAAYYFPTAGRMQGVEVRKGSSQVKYGPYTTGGAINFISTSIPKELGAKINLWGGNYGRRIAQASIGQSFEYGGFLLETYQNTSTGFKVLDNGGPTGFDNQDYVAKFQLNTPTSAKIFQSISVKAGQALGNSDETYLGLTEDDFSETPYRRYAASQLDHMATEQQQYSIKYVIIPVKFIDVSITAYQNNFKRNWYKLDNVKTGASSVSISDVLSDPVTYQNEYNVITGTTSANDDALRVRNNNREYYAMGVQGMIGFNFDEGVAKHDIEIGFRFHRDEEDRYQWDDQYKMESGVMELTLSGTPGTESNRISDAKAIASYLQYSLSYGNLRVLPGLRYEKIELTRNDFGKADPGRTGANLTKTLNNVDVWIPGIGAAYSFTKIVQGFIGIHRGFAPQGFDTQDKPEESINYEVGTRIIKSNFNAQAVIFFNDYENLLGSDLAAAGGGGTGDLFNAGKAETLGSEIEMSYIIAPSGPKGVGIPLSVAYTYTDGKFESSFKADNEDWGTVEEGDNMPYLARHQLIFNTGVQHSLFTVNLSSKYVGQMRTSPGKGEIPEVQRIDANFIIDLSANFRVSRFISAFGSVNNITDEEYAVARRPAGVRPGMPRSFLIGIKASF